MAKILVIDDEPNVQTLLAMLLRSQGYEVILADMVGRGYSCIAKNIPMSFCWI